MMTTRESPHEIIRLAEAIEHLTKSIRERDKPQVRAEALESSDGLVWEAETSSLHPVSSIHATEIDLLLGLDHIKKQLLANTRFFARGYAANNALLWGARGTGKSSLVKAVFKAILNEQASPQFKLVEISRDDLNTLPRLMAFLRNQKQRFVLFCDDLSFDSGDNKYKNLKSVLEGGLEGRPDNVIFYATSNRRHLLSRSMVDNEQGSAINPGEAVEEKVSLSDRFGLWLGFHHYGQDQYLAMVKAYAEFYGLNPADENLFPSALEWSITRGCRSGRVAWQFIQDRAGQLGKNLSF